MSSGVPVPLGLVMSASPTRKIVCVHVLPCAPTRAGDPAPVPPASIRSAIEQRVQIAGGGQRAERSDGDCGAERRPFARRRR